MLSAASPGGQPIRSPCPQPPSLEPDWNIDASSSMWDMEINLPPSVMDGGRPPVWQAPALANLPVQSCQPLGQPMPGGSNPLVVARPSDHPPLPPIYGEASPRSSGGSSSSSLSMRAGPLVSVQFEMALDRMDSGELRMDRALSLDPSARSRWSCW